MSDVGGVGGRPISPQDAKLYRQEYEEGRKLFERTLDRYSTSDNKYQKEQFLEVMDKACQVLNDAARALKDKELHERNLQIDKDLAAFKKNPNQKTAAKLREDLSK